ncbi:bifunctional DNA primase/polymerase [Kitasatospora sp. NPDC058162]|uniref:bifunctional DNA primase/polymerase n=1 Tax=Kitasatospora sp. NPDC058162 TaxID=3346362 RepID=UPI0036DA1121
MNRPDALKVATWCIGKGWYVHLLIPGGKIPPRGCNRCFRGADGRPNPEYVEHTADDCPCIPAGRWCHGVRAATNNVETFEQWLSHLPNAGVAVAMEPSRLIILDVDSHDVTRPDDGDYLPGLQLPADLNPDSIRDGWDTVGLLCEIRNAPLPTVAPPTMCVATPGGGVQVWYETGDTWRQSASRLGWQLDIKAGWAYGICPGTVTSKGTYRPLGDCRTVAPLPNWLAADLKRTGHHRVVETDAPRPTARQLLERLQRPKGAQYVNAAIRAEVERVVTAKSGTRNDTVNAAGRALGRFVPGGLVTESEVEELLVAAAVSAGLSGNEARAAARSGIKIGITKGRAA